MHETFYLIGAWWRRSLDPFIAIRNGGGAFFGLSHKPMPCDDCAIPILD